MNGSNIFLELTPTDEFGLAADSFRLQCNSARYAKPCSFIDDASSRETTPGEAGDDETPSAYWEFCHRIQLRFDQETKVKGRIIFGSNPDQCDVLLIPKRPHFYFTFDNERRPVICDDSKSGLSVSYDGQAKDERRRHFQWIIFPEDKTIRVTIPLRNNRELAFNVHLPIHYRTHQDGYEVKATRFLDGAPQEHELALRNLAIRSQDSSLGPSESLSPRQRPVYVKRGELGKGAFGRVRMVVDASTAVEYAGKEFFVGNRWGKEIEILKNLCHDYIVRFIDFKAMPEPLLIMEYLPPGDLRAQHKLSSITDDEMMVVFHQCLQGLVYLHDRNITHRDLKPENILFLSRTPIYVKLADFGLAQDKPDLKTFCGSPIYVAPEIFLGRCYTAAVDLWSLAVIVMKFVYGLPKCEKLNFRGEYRLWGQAWCQHLITFANDWESDPLIGLLTQYVLRREPEDRLPAAECIERGYQIGLFQNEHWQTGSATPRLRPNSRADDADTEDGSTIKGPMWQGIRQSRVSFTNDRDIHRSGTRSAKRRRTQDDYAAPAGSSDKQDSNDEQLLDPPAPTRKGSLDARVAGQKTTDPIDESDSLSGLPTIQPPLERYGTYVVQSAGPHRVHLRLGDARINFTTDTSPTGPWVDIPTARGLCAKFNIQENFRALLTFGEARQAQMLAALPKELPSEPIFPGFTPHIFGKDTFLVRDKDSWINATQLLRAAARLGRSALKWKEQPFEYDLIPFHGVYVPPNVAFKLCEIYNRPEAGIVLRDKFGARADNQIIVVDPLYPIEHFQFITSGGNSIAVRRSDLKVNVTQLCKASPHNRSHADIQSLKSKGIALEVVRQGAVIIQGSYAEFSVAISLCQELGLLLIIKALSEFKPTPDLKHLGEDVVFDNAATPGDSQRAAVINSVESLARLPGNELYQDGLYGELNISDIDRAFDMSRPSFRFTTSSHLSPLP